MSGLHSLLVAVELATRKRDEARRALQDLQSAQNAARDQLQQLEGYARETEDRWGMRADASVQPEVMYHHYQFMGRLDQAAQMQTKVVGDQGARVERARCYLLETELRLASLKKVTDRRRLEVELQQMRRDQKQTDERAALQYRGGNQGGHAQKD